MANHPKISAPIGRMRAKSGRKEPRSGDRWRSADLACETDTVDEDVAGEHRCPRFYPFPLPSAVDAED